MRDLVGPHRYSAISWATFKLSTTDRQTGMSLRELRCHYGRELFRILYRRSGKLVVLLHIFRKDTGKIPEVEIEIAKRRWNDFKARMDAEKRRPPRAAGHDAP